MLSKKTKERKKKSPLASLLCGRQNGMIWPASTMPQLVSQFSFCSFSQCIFRARSTTQLTGRLSLNQTLWKFHFPSKRKSVVKRKNQRGANATVLWVMIIAGCNQNNISFSLFSVLSFSFWKRNISFSVILYYSISLVIPSPRWPQGGGIVRRRIGRYYCG